MNNRGSVDWGRSRFMMIGALTAPFNSAFGLVTGELHVVLFGVGGVGVRSKAADNLLDGIVSIGGGSGGVLSVSLTGTVSYMGIS